MKTQWGWSWFHVFLRFLLEFKCLYFIISVLECIFNWLFFLGKTKILPLLLFYILNHHFLILWMVWFLIRLTWFFRDCLWYIKSYGCVIFVGLGIRPGSCLWVSWSNSSVFLFTKIIFLICFFNFICCYYLKVLWCCALYQISK